MHFFFIKISDSQMIGLADAVGQSQPQACRPFFFGPLIETLENTDTVQRLVSRIADTENISVDNNPDKSAINIMHKSIFQ